MASSSQIEAGRAFVRLFLKNDMASQLRRALSDAGSRLQSFGKSTMAAGAKLTGVGAAIVSPLALAVKSFSDAGDQLDKMALRTGVAGSVLAEFQFAAEQSGASLEDFENGLRRMQRTITDAQRGLSTANDGLELVGLTVQDLEGLSPDEQFQRIADGLAAINDPSKKAAAAMMLFGRSGTMLLPMLDSLGALRQEARDLGILPTEEEIKKAAEVNDALNRVRRVVKKIIFDVGAGLADPVLKFLEIIKNAGKSIGAFAKQYGSVIAIAGAVGVGLMIAGAAVTAFGAAIWGAGMALSAVGTAVGVLFSPIGLITAAVIAAGVAFVRWSETGRAAYAYLADTFGQLLSWVQTVFAGIRNAMAAGDMQLAAEIMWAGIQVAWAAGIAWIKTKWVEASFAMLDTLNYLWSEMVSGFWDAAEKVVDAWKWAEKSLAKGIAYVIAKLQGLDPNEVMATVEGDYGRQAAQRDRGRAERERANREAAESRYTAIEEARKSASSGTDTKLEDARKRLADALEKAAALKPVPPGAVVAKPGSETPDITTGQAPRGVGLTATYSAAAARIAGYQVTGPQQKMADGIEKIVRLTDDQNRQMEEFLAGWRVA